MHLIHLLANPAAAAAAVVNDPKADASAAPSPNMVFEPGTTFPLLATIFFIASAIMVWLIIRAGKGKNYGD